MLGGRGARSTVIETAVALVDAVGVPGRSRIWRQEECGVAIESTRGLLAKERRVDD
jgi:hypothetical protein